MSDKHHDSEEKMQAAHAWLDEVCDLLEIPRDLQRSQVKGVLDLTAAVAHNRSRPAAPVTAFLVGLAAGRDTQSADSEELRRAIEDRLETVTRAASEDEIDADTDATNGESH